MLQSPAGPRPGSSSTLGRVGLTSPKAASEVPKNTQSPAAPHAPTLGRGFSEGEDILFFENSSPPAAAPSALSLSAAKLLALKKLRAKGKGLQKEDPNAVKRKRSNSSEINTRVEKNLTSPKGTQSYLCLLNACFVCLDMDNILHNINLRDLFILGILLGSNLYKKIIH